jgi:sensory rhodopsin
MLQHFFLEITPISNDNYVAFTFFVGTMAMMAASVFFFFELGNTDKKWRTSVLVSGLITFIAAVHYYYMRGYNLETGQSPTFFRYVDWLLTVPLMCVEFYLITKSGIYSKLAVETYCRISRYAGNRLCR